MNTDMQALLDTFLGVSSRETVVFLMSMLPVVELRGGLLAASYLDIDVLRAVLLCVAGCFFPVPFILLLIRKILDFMKRFMPLCLLAEKIERRAMGKSEQISRYEFWGLVVFVGVPLPGTGAWTGALIAALLGLRPLKASLAIFIGVLISASLMTGIAYGLLPPIV